MAADDGQQPGVGWVADGAAPAGTALAGLDALDGPAGRAAVAGGLRSAYWNAFWPKILALALVLGIWELITLSGYKKLVWPATGPTLADLWDQAKGGTLWQAVGNTLQSAVIGFAVAIVIGCLIGGFVSRIYPLRAAVGSLITGLQTMPSIAWVPFAGLLFGNQQLGRSCSWSSWARPPSIANGLITGVDYTSRRCCSRRVRRNRDCAGCRLWRHLITARLAAGLRGRAQTGLGVRLAQPDGGRADRCSSSTTPTLGELLNAGDQLAIRRPSQRRHLDHDRDLHHRDLRRRPVRRGRHVHPQALGARVAGVPGPAEVAIS